MSSGKVAKTLKNMKKKKSAGVDGLSQENLILATYVLVTPLTSIVNASITKGEFHEEWINDSVKAWNQAPLSIKMQTNIHGAKNAIKQFVKTLPI